MQLFHTLANHVLTSRCLLCGLSCDGHSHLCRLCTGDLPWLVDPCALCGIPLIPNTTQLPFSGDHICGPCIKSPPVYDHCYAPFFYAPPMDYLISAFKDRHQMLPGRLLANLLTDFLIHTYHDQNWPHQVITVPVHWWRRLMRGFNQTEVLGYQLADKLPISVNTGHCRRLQARLQQRGQSRRQRQRNLHQVFTVNGDFSGQHIAILDDVVTTGSTVTEISRLLRAAGATRIDIWALARTPSVSS